MGLSTLSGFSSTGLTDSNNNKFFLFFCSLFIIAENLRACCLKSHYQTSGQACQNELKAIIKNG
jgi:hypothetical protein